VREIVLVGVHPASAARCVNQHSTAHDAMNSLLAVLRVSLCLPASPFMRHRPIGDHLVGTGEAEGGAPIGKVTSAGGQGWGRERSRRSERVMIRGRVCSERE
jgi:hypothetical protein